jgi:hypothetical protein
MYTGRKHNTESTLGRFETVMFWKHGRTKTD